MFGYFFEPFFYALHDFQKTRPKNLGKTAKTWKFHGSRHIA